MSDIPKISVADVVEAVAAHYGLTSTAILSSRRDALVSRARHVACWLAGRLTVQSNCAIGRALRIDHATVIVGRRDIEERRSDPATADLLEGMEAAVLAVARLRERKAAPPPRHIDPFETARRIVEGGDRAAGLVSIVEIRAVCEALDALAGEHDDYIGREEFRGAVQATLAAHRELRAALYTSRERRARERLETALDSLSTHFSTPSETAHA
jgi:hypothetical protein